MNLKKILTLQTKPTHSQRGWIPAAIMGASMLAGGILGNQQNASNTADTNKTNQKIAKDNNAFQERMSNSAYQRAMADMGKAGLNPMLAYSQGGASSPTGTTIAAQTPNYQDPIGPAVSGAISAHKTTQDLKMAAGHLGIQGANSGSQIALNAAKAQATATSAKKTLVETEIAKSRAKKEHLEGRFYDSDAGKTMYMLNKVNEAAGGTLDSLNGAKKLLNPFPELGRGKKITEKLNRRTGELEKWTK